MARSAGVVLINRLILLTNTTPASASPQLAPPQLRRGAVAWSVDFQPATPQAGITVNYPTVGRISNGATVERTVVTGLTQTLETLDLELDNFDFNVGLVTLALNNSFGQPIASSLGGT